MDDVIVLALVSEVIDVDLDDVVVLALVSEVINVDMDDVVVLAPVSEVIDVDVDDANVLRLLLDVLLLSMDVDVEVALLLVVFEVDVCVLLKVVAVVAVSADVVEVRLPVVTMEDVVVLLLALVVVVEVVLVGEVIEVGELLVDKPEETEDVDVPSLSISIPSPALHALICQHHACVIATYREASCCCARSKIHEGKVVSHVGGIRASIEGVSITNLAVLCGTPALQVPVIKEHTCVVFSSFNLHDAVGDIA
eukprot:2441400-Amphidinium_carterae.1